MGALARTHRGLEYETPSRQDLPRAKSRQNIRESAHTLPEARGLLSGTTKKGPLSKSRKNCLDPVKIKAKRQPLANPHLVRGYRFSASLEASRVRPRMGNRFSVSLEAPHVKPRTRCRFFASLEAGSATTPSPPPRPISPTECHVQLMRPTTPATSAGRRLDTAERPTRHEVASAPYRPGQDRAGVTGRCARYCAHD